MRANGICAYLHFTGVISYKIFRPEYVRIF